MKEIPVSQSKVFSVVGIKTLNKGPAFTLCGAPMSVVSKPPQWRRFPLPPLLHPCPDLGEGKGFPIYQKQFIFLAVCTISTG